MPTSISRQDVLGYRVRAQGLDRERATIASTSALNIGVQDTGTEGGLWALAVRGVATAELRGDGPGSESTLATAWTVRGAPHLYRRADLPQVALATAPYSDADAGKRIFDAAKPLKAAGISNLEALSRIAGEMRRTVTAPMAKGELSTRLNVALDEPYRRFCRPCNATHLYEMPFRLAALQAGLELQPGTSPPVLQPIPEFTPATQIPDRLDLVRAYLRLLGPATPQHVAGYIDAPSKDIKAHWPEDAVEILVEQETRWMLTEDVPALSAGPARTVRLLGGFDLFLQTKERPLLVPDATAAKVLWPVLGRPGAVLVDGEIAGIWRPRKSGTKLTVAIQMWTPGSARLRAAIEVQAQKLAEFRRASLASVTFS